MGSCFFGREEEQSIEYFRGNHNKQEKYKQNKKTISYGYWMACIQMLLSTNLCLTPQTCIWDNIFLKRGSLKGEWPWAEGLQDEDGIRELTCIVW